MPASRLIATAILLAGLLGTPAFAQEKAFSPEADFISLHYDHAPDKDDGHSAAADRCMLETLFGQDWIADHVVAVSGAYGENADTFNAGSDAVMDAAWNDCGGWLAAHANRDAVVAQLVKRWGECLASGGDVWVKEGGQSDITTDVLRALRDERPDIDASKRIHVVQHSDWNEHQTTDAALEYAKTQAHYIRIRDANEYLNVRGGDREFEAAAVGHPRFGRAWRAAFEYYSPRERLDFSDTGELMHILGLGELGISRFQDRFLVRDAGEPGGADQHGDD